jgi:hypothetical protein
MPDYPSDVFVLLETVGAVVTLGKSIFIVMIVKFIVRVLGCIKYHHPYKPNTISFNIYWSEMKVAK